MLEKFLSVENGPKFACMLRAYVLLGGWQYLLDEHLSRSLYYMRNGEESGDPEGILPAVVGDTLRWAAWIGGNIRSVHNMTILLSASAVEQARGTSAHRFVRADGDHAIVIRTWRFLMDGWSESISRFSAEYNASRRASNASKVHRPTWWAPGGRGGPKDAT